MIGRPDADATVSDLGEHALIARIIARLAMPPWVVVGPGDDAAVLEPERGALEVLTTDAQVEGIHFDRRFSPPEAIGHRALAVNLSDLAAMGATPRAALLSLVLPHDFPVPALDALVGGLLALASRHRVPIVGGNITRSPGPLVIDVTATGAVRRRRILTRGGARPGDDVYVTGAIGRGAVGLQSLRAGASGDVGAEASAGCREWYVRPEPRVKAGVLLGRSRAATACVDLSDGLADGIQQLAAASGVGLAIDGDALPIDEGARRWHEAHGADPVAAVLAGGDDYELLFTVRRTQRSALRDVRRRLGDLPITRIGVVTKERRNLLRTTAGEREVTGGFEHFR